MIIILSISYDVEIVNSLQLNVLKCRESIPFLMPSPPPQIPPLGGLGPFPPYSNSEAETLVYDPTKFNYKGMIAE